VGISQPRVSQVVGLLWLPAATQERVLLGDLGVGTRDPARDDEPREDVGS
jgi:hypothetical protein